MSSLGIDYGRLEEAKRRLERAGVIVDGILGLARELDELVTDPEDPVAYALDTAARLNGNGASPPDAPAELNAGGDPSPPPASSSSTLGASASASHRSRDDSKAGPAPAPRRNRPGATTDAVLIWLEAHPGEWHRIGTIARELGLSTGSVKSALYGLRRTATVEHNGEPTTRSRWRLDPGLADEQARDERIAAEREAELEERDEAIAELETPNPIDPAADGDDDEQDDDDVEVYRGPDVKRELERTAGLAPPLRSAGILGRRASVALKGPQGEAREELRRRVTAQLLEGASTITELAGLLEVERTELAPVVLELVEEEGPIVPVRGAFRGRGETIYSNVA